MTDTQTFAWAPLRRRRYGFEILSGMFAAWDERIHFRHDLQRMAADSPHLIADIGLTMQQAEAEIAKPFWQQ